MRTYPDDTTVSIETYHEFTNIPEATEERFAVTYHEYLNTRLKDDWEIIELAQTQKRGGSQAIETVLTDNENTIQVVPMDPSRHQSDRDEPHYSACRVRITDQLEEAEHYITVNWDAYQGQEHTAGMIKSDAQAVDKSDKQIRRADIDAPIKHTIQSVAGVTAAVLLSTTYFTSHASTQAGIGDFY